MNFFSRLVLALACLVIACEYAVGYVHSVKTDSKNNFHKNLVRVVSFLDLIRDSSKKQWYKIDKQSIFSRNKGNKLSEDSDSSSNKRRPSIENNKINIGEYSYSNYSTQLQPFEEVQPDANRKPLMLARLLSWMLKRIVVAKTEDIRGLHMNIHTSSNRDVVKGRFDTIELKFDKVSYRNFFVSGGGRLIVKDLDLTMRKLLFQNNIHSVRKPYKIYCDLLLTQQDIVQSKFIKQIIQLIVDTILEKVMGSNRIMNIAVKRVNIKDHKIHASGVARILADAASTKQLHSLASLMNYPTTTPPSSSSSANPTSRSAGTGSSSATTGSNTTTPTTAAAAAAAAASGPSKSPTGPAEQAELVSMDFQISSGMGIKHSGQTVYLKDIVVTLNPDTILSTIIPITTVSPIEIDIGDDSRIQSLVVARKNIWVRAASVVSTVQPFAVATVRRRSAYHYDLSALLTSVLILRGGIITHRLSCFSMWLAKKRDNVMIAK